MHRIAIVGAGQLGSRHLQALQAVSGPLAIQVLDPSEASLERARARFAEADRHAGHTIRFGRAIEAGAAFDLAIVATNADTRVAALSALLDAASVRFLILEKLLFDRRADAGTLAALAANCEGAWVNCAMRVMPAYEELRHELGPGPVRYRVTGSRYGLVTNAIHYLDHVVHLTGCATFTLDTRDVDLPPVPSKRPGFLELTGSLDARFADGSRCEIVCHADGEAPVLVEIFTSSRRFLVREDAGRMWTARAEGGWQWQERDARIPFQSELTATVVERLRDTGDAGLSPLPDSIAVHLQLLEPLGAALTAAGIAPGHYPFT